MASNNAQNGEYSVDFLVDFFKMYDESITKPKFTSMKPEYIQQIYTFIVQDFGVDIARLNDMEDVEYSDMYKPVLFAVRLAKSVQCLLKKIYNIDDFYIGDVLEPKLDRTVQFLSLLTHFYVFVSTNQEEVDDVFSKVSKKDEAFEKLRKDIEEKKEKLNLLKKKKVEDQITVEKLQRNLESEINEFKETHDTMLRRKGRLEGLNSKISELNLMTKERELENVQLEEKIEMLKTQVVLEEDIMNFEKCQEKLVLEKEFIRERKEDLKNRNQSCQILEKMMKSMNEASTALEDYDKVVKMKDEYLNKLQEAEDDLNSAAKELDESSREMQSKIESAAVTEDWISKQKKNSENLKHGVNAKIEEQLRDIKILETRKMEDDSKMKKVQEKIRTLQERKTDLLEKEQTYIQYVRDKQSDLYEMLKKVNIEE